MKKKRKHKMNPYQNEGSNIRSKRNQKEKYQRKSSFGIVEREDYERKQLLEMEITQESVDETGLLRRRREKENEDSPKDD